MEAKALAGRVKSLTKDLPPLPDFSRFHSAFLPNDGSGTVEGDIRAAFFLAYDESKCEYFPLEDGSMESAMATGRDLVSTSFIIPYPPGFPILVPGQVISREILTFMRALDVKEIHGYNATRGLKLIKLAAIGKARPGSKGAAKPAAASGKEPARKGSKS
jgi:arginine decarboxylase